MKKDKELLWQAYVDGELSASEMAEFEQSLNAEERDLLAGEVRFESGLAETLSHGAKCPDDVWQRTLGRLEEEHSINKTPVSQMPMRRRWYWGLGSLAAAASLAFVISVYAPSFQPAEPSMVVMAAETVEQLAEQSETGTGNENVQNYLHEHDMALNLLPVESLEMNNAHSHISLIGARSVTAGESKVVEMFFACCEHPVKVVMVEQGSVAAAILGQAAGEVGQVKATRTVGKYLTAVVSNHPAFGLLDIFAGQNPASDMNKGTENMAASI